MPNPPTSKARVTAPAPKDNPSSSDVPLQVKSEPLVSPPTTATVVRDAQKARVGVKRTAESAPASAAKVATAAAGASKGRASQSSAPTPPLCGKNLRWTAVALARKLRTERERPSTALCDEVAADAAAEMRVLHPGRDVSGVERNTRRRVYDALKVMTSLGCVVREDVKPNGGSGGGRILRWESPARKTTPRSPELTQLTAHVAEARNRLCAKRAKARELARQLAAFDDNARRAATAAVHAGKAPRVRFPFVLVAGEPVRPPVPAAANSLEVSYAHPFRLYSETDVVALLRSHRTAPRNKKRPRVPRPSVNAGATATPAPTPPISRGASTVALPTRDEGKAAPPSTAVHNGDMVAKSEGVVVRLPPALTTGPPFTGNGVDTPVMRTPVKEEARFLLSPATPVSLLQDNRYALHGARAALLGYSGGAVRSDIDDLGELSCLDDADFGQEHS